MGELCVHGSFQFFAEGFSCWELEEVYGGPLLEVGDIGGCGLVEEGCVPFLLVLLEGVELLKVGSGM